MRLADFDFDLPAELIAQHPPAQRTASRLLEVRADGLTDPQCIDRRFSDLPSLLQPGDLLVMNDTRVLKARLIGHKQATGGAVEALVERIPEPGAALVLLRASKTPGPGTRLVFGTAQAQVLGREGEFFRLRFEEAVAAVLEREGRLPLPPYIEHLPDGQDEQRYQTVYARVPGAAAAPTAGLHFDEPLLATLRARGVEIAWVTLHVGAGTFQPVRVDDLALHHMHSEWYHIDAAVVAAIDRARARGARIVAVGTTSLRALESAAQADGSVLAGSRETSLFITPGYTFRVVDRLITNFHLPKSTLLMLVAAFAGHARVQQAYAHAIAQRYRFFSYGDAMLLARARGHG